jgi:hypothetical protein
MNELLLSHISQYSKLDQADQQSFEDVLEPKTLKKGDCLLTEGHICHY